MKNALSNFIAVLAQSTRMQLAISLGMIFYIVISLFGQYWVSNIEFHGVMKVFEETFINKFARRYDKIALFSLISFWVLAFKFYLKDRKRFW